MILKSQVESIIEYGTKAPSGHNTQPWKFMVKENDIQIHPDFSRTLPVVDPDNHALYISLGCAAENIVLAAKNFGFNSTLKLFKDENAITYINIELQELVEIKRDDLFDSIKQRQVTRNAYSSEEVSLEDLNKIRNAIDFQDIELQLFTTKKNIKRLEPFIIEGSDLQFQNKAFVNELTSWVRFSKSEVTEKQDGISYASMQMPSVGRFIGSIIMKRFITAKSEAKKWKKIIDASAGFALFTVQKNDISHWVDLGRALQRFGLITTKLKINHAHVNMPCEEKSVRNKMATALGLKNKHPLLLVRFGYSDRLPYSHRRPANKVIYSRNQK